MAAPKDDWISYTNSHHYIIDGVPMKINNLFRPKKITDSFSLASNIRVHRSQSKVLDFKYEFETENGYIQWYDEYIKEKKDREKAKQLKIEQEKRSKQKVKTKDSPKPSTTATTTTTPTAGLNVNSQLPSNSSDASGAQVTRPVAPNFSGTRVPTVSNVILEPQRASPVPVSNPSTPLMTASTSNSNAGKNVNLKDFENIGEDPFDNLELKTINDAEELKSVFDQVGINSHKPDKNLPQLGKADGTIYENTLSNTDTYENVRLRKKLPQNGAIYENCHIPVLSSSDTSETEKLSSTKLSDDSNNLRRPQSVAKLKLPVAQPRNSLSLPSSPEKSPEEVLQVSPKVADKKVNENPTSSPVGGALPTSSTVAKQKPVVKPKPISTKPKDTKSESSRIQSIGNFLEKTLNNAVGSQSKNAVKGFSYVQLCNKESNDAVKGIEWPSLDRAEEKGKDETPNRSIDSTAGSNKLDSSSQSDSLKSGQVPVENLSSASSLDPVIYTKPKKPVRPPPPPPLKKRSNGDAAPKTGVGDDEVFNSLLAMGFDREQISTAKKRLGSNTKKLIDHLIAVQQLTSTGARWEYAHEAVFLFDSDIRTAERFVTSYQKLIEFGFESDKIKKALLNCDMDQERALDQLLV